MKKFKRRLTEALGDVGPQVDISAFLRFAGAIATSSQVDKIPAALQKAATLSPDQLAAIIGQVQYNGDIMALKNAVANNPNLAVALAELGRKVLPESYVQVVMNDLAGGKEDFGEMACNSCGKAIDRHNGWFQMDSDPHGSLDSVYCSEECAVKKLGPHAAADAGGSYTESDDDDTGDAVEYNADADYYHQGADFNPC